MQGNCLNPWLCSTGSVQINHSSCLPWRGLSASHRHPECSAGLHTCLKQVLNGLVPLVLHKDPEKYSPIHIPPSPMFISQSLYSKFRFPLHYNFHGSPKFFQVLSRAALSSRSTSLWLLWVELCSKCKHKSDLQDVIWKTECEIYHYWFLNWLHFEMIIFYVYWVK